MPYKDRDAQRAAQRRHYEKHRERFAARMRAYHAKERPAIRALIAAHLANHPCVDCGESDPIVLEFDHRDPALKRFNIGGAATHRFTLRVVQAEIEKCDVRCANCHRRKTHRDRQAMTRGGAPVARLAHSQEAARSIRAPATTLLLFEDL
jgi:hypothetical protein